jgi:hypothetical protein
MFSSNMVKHFLLIIVLVFTTNANLLAGLKIPGNCCEDQAGRGSG